MTYEQSRNEVELCGTPLSAPVFSHENHGKRFFRFLLRIPRLSGTPDVLPVVVPEVLTPDILPGAPLHVRGQLRSFNNKSGVGSRLVITVLVRSARESEPGEGENRLTLAGAICKAPVRRRTPLGREICDLLLAVNRPYGRADYLPCIAWGSLAVLCGQKNVGDRLRLEGRLQSRQYRKLVDGVETTRTAYEVSVMNLLPEEDQA